jgi:hypothetical protein
VLLLHWDDPFAEVKAYSSIPNWNMSRSTFSTSLPKDARLERVASRDRTLQWRGCCAGNVAGKFEINVGDNYHRVTYDECMGEMKEIAMTCQKDG